MDISPSIVESDREDCYFNDSSDLPTDYIQRSKVSGSEFIAFHTDVIVINGRVQLQTSTL